MNIRLIGTAVIAALVAVGCGKKDGSSNAEKADVRPAGSAEKTGAKPAGSGEQVAEPNHVEAILALAKKSADEDNNINFCGFFTGMSRYDAADLAAYYKLKEGEYTASAWFGKAVSRLWFSLKGVRRITGGGNTIDELAQAVANRVGDLKGYHGKWMHKTIDGVVVIFSSEGLTIQNDSLASQEPIVTKRNALKEGNAKNDIIMGIIGNMAAIPGKSFKMGKYEVTRTQWQVVMGVDPSPSLYRTHSDDPVEPVSWNDCKAFLKKLNAMPEVRVSGLRFRLPTEAEWEYACRAGGTGDYCRLEDGGEITEVTLDKVAWYCENSGYVTHPVGQKEPNAFGLYDMHGNVWEWCEDREEDDGLCRAFRGGNCNSGSKSCAAGYQSYGHPGGPVGFRLVASQNDEADMDEAEKAVAEKAARKERGKERAAKEAGLRLIKEMIAIPNKRFKIGKYEVTQAQWQAIMGENPSYYKNADNPVENVSWDDCKKFLEKLNAMPEVRASGLTFRLPTEEEWYYACRAGSTGDYCQLVDGTEISKSTLGEVAWYSDNSAHETHPVGQKKPNAFGLYDMLGNVWEWCEDLYETGHSKHVFRGGNWRDGSRDCTAGFRGYDRPGDCLSGFLGFRLAADQD